MDTTTRAGTPLRQRMLDDMRMRKLEPKTRGRRQPRSARHFSFSPRARRGRAG